MKLDILLLAIGDIVAGFLTFFVSILSKIIGVVVFVALLFGANWAKELVSMPLHFLHVLWAFGFFYQPFPRNNCKR